MVTAVLFSPCGHIKKDGAWLLNKHHSPWGHCAEQGQAPDLPVGDDHPLGVSCRSSRSTALEPTAQAQGQIPAGPLTVPEFCLSIYEMGQQAWLHVVPGTFKKRDAFL